MYVQRDLVQVDSEIPSGGILPDAKRECTSVVAFRATSCPIAAIELKHKRGRIMVLALAHVYDVDHQRG